MDKRRTTVEKPYNGGTWTTARMRSFVMSGLRQASMRWPAKHKVINECYVKDGTTDRGHKCKLHKCPECGKLVKKGDLIADHIKPVIPIQWDNLTNTFVGYDWTTVIRNLFCEKEGFQARCKECHQKKTNGENEQRN